MTKLPVEITLQKRTTQTTQKMYLSKYAIMEIPVVQQNGRITWAGTLQARRR